MEITKPRIMRVVKRRRVTLADVIGTVGGTIGLFTGMSALRDPIQQKNLWLEFCLENSLRFHFDTDTCLEYPFLKFFLVEGISGQNSSDLSFQNWS